MQRASVLTAESSDLAAQIPEQLLDLGEIGQNDADVLPDPKNLVSVSG